MYDVIKQVVKVLKIPPVGDVNCEGGCKERQILENLPVVSLLLVTLPLSLTGILICGAHWSISYSSLIPSRIRITHIGVAPSLVGQLILAT